MKTKKSHITIKRLLNIITTILSIYYIPMIAYIVYIQKFKVYSNEGFMAGLSPAGDALAILVIVVFNTVIIALTRIVYYIHKYRVSEKGTVDKQHSKNMLQVITIPLIIAISYILYWFIG